MKLLIDTAREKAHEKQMGMQLKAGRRRFERWNRVTFVSGTLSRSHGHCCNQCMYA